MKDLKAQPNLTRFSLAALIFLLAAFSANSRAASPMMQDSLRKSVYGGGKPQQPKLKLQPSKPANQQTSRQTNNYNANKPKVGAFVRPTATANRTRVVRRNSIARSKPALLNVTFTAQQPNLEIWLNDKIVGRTDQNAKFEKKLAPNIYRVTVRKGDQIVVPVKIIGVSPDYTDFKLFAETAIQKSPEPPPTPIVVEEKKKSAEELAEETSLEIKRILEDYADPAKTDSIGVEDWELIFQSAQLGQLQGFTAVQIEAQRWFASGQIEIAKRDYPSAVTAFNKAIEFMPRSALPFYGLGNAYLANNQPAEALRAFQQAARLEPRMAMAYKGIGDAQRLLKNKKEALAAYKNAVQYGYTAPETRLRLALMLSENDRVKESLQQLEQLAYATPTAEIYIAIGDAYRRLQQNVSAVEYYRKALEQQPDLPAAHFKLGSVYLDEREYSKAKAYLEKAVELDPSGKTVNNLDARRKARLAASKMK